MRSGKCPKCSSTEIYRQHAPETGGGIGWADQYNLIRVTAKWGGATTRMWETFLCANCGYFENYILDREILDTVMAVPEAGWVKLEG